MENNARARADGAKRKSGQRGWKDSRRRRETLLPAASWDTPKSLLSISFSTSAIAAPFSPLLAARNCFCAQDEREREL